MTPADFLPFGQGAGLDDLPRSLPALMSMKSMKCLCASGENGGEGGGWPDKAAGAGKVPLDIDKPFHKLLNQHALNPIPSG